MKKLMTVCAACMVAGMVSAQVESQNIVGYDTTVQMTSGEFNFLGSNFIEVGGADSTLKALLNYTPTINDQVQVWNGSGYDLYTYKTALVIPIGPVTDWFDATNTQADPVLAAGTGFWFKPAANTDIVFSGEVADAASDTLTVVANAFNMLCNVYPVDVQLKDLTFDDLQINDQVQIWNGSGYDLYTYKTALVIPIGPVTDWFDSTNTQANPVISAGTGFWFKPVASTSVTFPSPL